MVSTETAVINEFMQSECGIIPNPKSLEILVNAGFKKINNPSSQFSNLQSVERKIRGSDLDSLVASVFSLAFPYEHVLEQQGASIRDWSAWLGTTEYKLSRSISDPQVKNILFNKGLEHLLKSREKGNGNKLNASYIGSCYFELRRYEEALHFFLESRREGGSSKEKASYIGRCYFELNQYEEGLNEYEKAIELAKQERFSGNWMIALDHALENSYGLLYRAKETIQSPVYEQLVQRFQAFYNNFIDFWKANEPNKNKFRLRFNGLSNQIGGISVAVRQYT